MLCCPGGIGLVVGAAWVLLSRILLIRSLFFAHVYMSTTKATTTMKEEPGIRQAIIQNSSCGCTMFGYKSVLYTGAKSCTDTPQEGL